MVEVGLAFVCALVAWSATAALAARCYRGPQSYMWGWAAAVLAVTVALSAAFPGALLDFSGVTFRVFHLGVGLFGPLLLGWAAVEYVVTSPRVRFGVRLVTITLAVVPLVILLMDRLRGSYENSYPAAGDHYDVIPMTVLGLTHLFVAVVLFACLIVALRGWREYPQVSRHQLTVVGLTILAAVLEITVSRFGLGVLGQLMLVGAVAAVWSAVSIAATPSRDRRRRRSRGGRRGDDYDEPGYDDEDDYDDEPEPSDHGDDRFEPPEEDVRRRRREPGPHEEPAVSSRLSRLYGIITIYTLADGHGEVFDDCAEKFVDKVARYEPDTLLFACHTVPSAPLQRIIYAIYRDQLAYEEHEQQPHVADFARERARHVVATNVIELSLAGASATDNLVDMLMPR
ncbi:putative quinol monooxygenase [Salinactinospora qingdaonensis]|uniref:ABM domain-containing protein n=1 Tax=Salinactinospora qingdaonensis TaxID=702744 RepID=A0ABP7F7J7_9ACTN